MSKIFLQAQKNYNQSEIDSAILKAFNFFGGPEKFFLKGERVLLKVNLVAGHEPERRVTTDPSIVKAVAKLALDHGAIPFIADSPGIDNFKAAAQKAGFLKISEELGIECHELTDPVDLPAQEGADFHKIQVSRYVLEADKIISLAKLKTHGQMYLTMGVKNLFGCVPGRLKAGWHYNVGLNRERFASLILDIYRGVKPDFTIIDGVIGMDGDGPTSGDPYEFGLIGASVDALTMDFWLCKMLGAKFEDYPLWLAAKRRKFPECNLNPEDLAGDFPADYLFEGVNIPKTRTMRLLPRLPFIERAMTSRPVHIPELCIGCGRCQAVCAAGALKHENKRLHFDYKKCIRCYCCHEMCPVKAIEFKESKLLSFINRIR
ncbi:MAG: DUF362 domain-containing protein [Synergistaceae bacterium]|nr:DUF362 domain-containing protein [Synergistaceae bacterium]